MKGNDKITGLLNAFLADELTAISQYMVHSEMCANWQYGKLNEATGKRAKDEMRHAERLIARIIFLEGKPIVSELKNISIGAAVDEQLMNDRAAEDGAIQAYNDGVRLCLEPGDNGTRPLIDENLKDEEDHLDWLEAQLDQIAQMGLQNYLLAQTH